MTALVVILIIVLIFAFFLNMKVRAEISFLGGKFDFSVKYLCFTFFPVKEKKPKKTKKSKKKSKSEDVSEERADTSENADIDAETELKSDETADAVEEKKDKKKKEKKEKEPLSDKIDKLFDIIEKVKIIWSVAKKWLVHIFKHIYIENLMIDFIIADEDAYKAAMNYGKINAAIYNLINLIRTVFTVTVKTVDIICDFEKKEPVYDFSVKITVRPATILTAVFAILFGLLINLPKLIGKKKTKQPNSEKAVST